MIDNNQNINNIFQNGLIQNEINPNGQIPNDIEWIWNSGSVYKVICDVNTRKYFFMTLLTHLATVESKCAPRC